MYVVGIASARRLPADVHLVDLGPLLALAQAGAVARRARISTTSAPTLWRVRAYSAPGFPRPTTSRSAGVPVRGPLRPPRRSTG